MNLPCKSTDSNAKRIGDVQLNLNCLLWFPNISSTFRVLFCFLVLLHDRRKVVHFNVTANPSAPWAAQQVIEAFPFDQAPRFLLRDRDSIYNERFRRRVRGMGITEVVLAPRSPYVERIIGSIRRDCLDHLIVLGEGHLRRILSRYFAYYHEDRTHLALDRNAPNMRAVERRRLKRR